MEALNFHIENAKIIDPKSGDNGKTLDIIIENGIITRIGSSLSSDLPKISSSNLCVSPGWMDLIANFRDPGQEYKEDVYSGIEAAKNGGFTEVGISPNTVPPITNKADIEYIKSKANNRGIKLHPIGALSEDMKGENISEMYDMHNAGAVAFYDDKRVVNSGLMNRALLYAKNFNGVVFSFPYDRALGEGHVNEGNSSTLTGLQSIPSIAEDLQIARDLTLCEYNETGVHFSIVSTRKGLDMIRKAKAKGQQITCSTTPMHLMFSEAATEEFDSNFKVLPPLRSEDDRLALWEGLKDGTITCITGDHCPEDIENKQVEFDQASFGVSSLETLYACLNQSKEWNDDLLYSTLVSGPREIIGHDIPSITEGQAANLTLFDSSIEWTYDKPLSKSQNSPYINSKMKGKVIRTII